MLTSKLYKKNNKGRINKNIVVHYIFRYFEARNTWRLNKEFWIVTVLGLLSAFIASLFIGTWAILVPFALLIFIPFFIVSKQLLDIKMKKQKRIK